MSFFCKNENEVNGFNLYFFGYFGIIGFLKEGDS